MIAHNPENEGQAPMFETQGQMTRKNHESRIFDTSTIKGLQAAERYQARVYNTYDSVTVHAIGSRADCWFETHAIVSCKFAVYLFAMRVCR